jgi:fatty-acyl-CoA synthase
MRMSERGHGLADLLRRTARRYPHKLAIACGDVAWSWRQFDALCDRLAAGLHASGISKGSHIAVLSRNSHAFAALRFAVARVGAVLVPVNFMLRAEEVAFVLRHAGVQTLAVDAGLAELGRAAAALDTRVQRFVGLPGESTPEPTGERTLGFAALTQTQALPAAAEVAGKDTAQIVYTSGTESLPKGAQLSHEAIIWQYVSCIVDGEMTADDLMLHALPLYHCAQLDVFLGPAVYLGCTSVITGTPTADNLLALLQRHRITSFFAPPTVWISLLRSPAFDATDLSALRKGYYGASIMPVEVLRELQRRLPQVRLWNFYGQTEIAPLATVLKPEDQLRKPGSAGRPVLNVETRVVDDDMRDVAVGQVGEIVHRSPQLLSGYYQDAERTAAAFEGGWFHSGDLAVVDDEGYISIVDRKKDMIKTGGENVASREVEETLYGLPQVSEVAVIGLPHPRWVEAVTAVVVVKHGEALTEREVIDACSRKLGGFKVPKGVVFVDALPKNPSGKLLKRELRQRLRSHYAE